MIEDPIRSAFEHIDEDASDEFRDALHARLLAELVGHDTSGQDESNDVVTLMSGDAAIDQRSPVADHHRRRGGRADGRRRARACRPRRR